MFRFTFLSAVLPVVGVLMRFDLVHDFLALSSDVYTTIRFIFPAGRRGGILYVIFFPTRGVSLGLYLFSDNDQVVFLMKHVLGCGRLKPFFFF